MVDRARSRSRSLFATVGSISAATGVSRVLGLVRDQVQAYFFGASIVTDAFVVAFRVPNLLRDLFAEGALSSAFVPTFTAARERDGVAAARALADRVVGALVVVLGVLTIVLLVFAPEIVSLYAVGFDSEKLALTVTMTRILSPFLLFVALAAVAMGVLNASGRFFVPALAPASFNVCSIVGVVALVPLLRQVGREPGLALAIAALAGGAAQFLVQLPSLWREGYRVRPRFDPADPGVRRIGKLMLPATFGLAATQINILVDTSLASMQGTGAITYLQYAFRMMQLPIGLFGVAIATANLARVSRDAAVRDPEALRRNLAASLRMAAVLTLPATAGLVALREPVVRILFERGRFVAEDTSMTAAAVLCYSAGLYAYAVTKIQVPTFYALADTRRPVVASAIAVAIKIAASLALIAALPRFGIQAFLGLALSTSFAAWVNLAVLAAGLRRRVGSFTGLGVVDTTVRVAFVAVGMGVAVAAFHDFSFRVVGPGGTLVEIVRVAIDIVGGVALTGIGLWVCGVEEGRTVVARLLRRRSRHDRRGGA